MRYTPFEIEKMMDSMVVLVDTREHPNPRFEKRVADFGCPWERVKLDFGDYSCKYTDIGGKDVSLASSVAIERKQDGNELAMCFGKERKRFEREFIRAKESGAVIYLLVEDECWESLYAGKYGKNPRFRSKLNPRSLVGSIHAWQSRYRMNLQFCEPDTTGILIADILKYELRERLENE